LPPRAIENENDDENDDDDDDENDVLSIERRSRR
jgi:hypothetical protein